MARNWLRPLGLTLATVLGFQATWLVSVELLRPSPGIFRMDQAAALTAAQKQTHAVTAAYIGVFRGDLWADAAFTYSSILWMNYHSDDTSHATQLHVASTMAERALTFAPHRSAMWLMLAALILRSNTASMKANEAIKMSHYTASSDSTLIPHRAQLSVQIETMDPELQELFKHDVRTIVRHMPDLKSTIIALYKSSRPVHRQLIEAALADSDPALLSALRPQSAL